MELEDFRYVLIYFMLLVS